MGGVQLAVAVQEVFLPVMTVDVAVADFVPQVVSVCALAVNHTAEFPLTDHIDDGHFIRAVAAVFQHHALTAGFFRRMHHGPAFLHRGRSAYLHAHFLPGAHGFDGNRNMADPIRKNKDGFDFRHGQHGVIILHSDGMGRKLHSFLHPVLINVADRRNFHVRHTAQHLQLTNAAAPQSDHAHLQQAAFLGDFHLYSPFAFLRFLQRHCSIFPGIKF